jgi:hypothetical protein
VYKIWGSHELKEGWQTCRIKFAHFRPIKLFFANGAGVVALVNVRIVSARHCNLRARYCISEDRSF